MKKFERITMTIRMNTKLKRTVKKKNMATTAIEMIVKKVMKTMKNRPININLTTKGINIRGKSMKKKTSNMPLTYIIPAEVNRHMKKPRSTNKRPTVRSKINSTAIILVSTMKHLMVTMKVVLNNVIYTVGKVAMMTMMTKIVITVP